MPAAPPSHSSPHVPLSATAEVVIRRVSVAHGDDIRAIHTLAHKSWPVTFGPILSEAQLAYELETHYTEAAIVRQLHAGQQYALVFLPDAPTVPVGFCAWTIEPKYVVLHKLYLDPDIKGRGLGRALMAFVETQARHTDRLEVRLNVNRHNEGAIGFYKHLGFEPLYEVDLPSGPFQRNDLVMAKALSADPKKVPFKLTEQVSGY
ncbi:MAG: GNAT family N-acetyltransferase [Cyanobacteria bacterium HKST-UBA05]|nr:GNAT family N-acetyltransferase [Cyanobacteria bacterium HKST-UBA05]